MKKNKKYIIGLGFIVSLVIAYFIIDSILFDGFKARTISESGIQAQYYAKTNTANKTAIILLGGGQWGDYWAAEFAKIGYVGLSLTYAGNNGLPKLPEEIPLEYFEQAIKWLQIQPEVNSKNIVVMGASKNAELALLLASYYPEIINGVIAYAPSSVSWSNTVLPYNSDDIKASWTYKGNDIPYIAMPKFSIIDDSISNTMEYWQMGLNKTTEVDKASIKVEKIQGPILLLSGKDDKVWPSSPMADMLEKRIKEVDFTYSFENIKYENAGHQISGNPESSTDVRNGEMIIKDKKFKFDYGGTTEGDNIAKRDAKLKVFKFIESL